MSLADLEARVEHEEEGLSCAVEGVARPQRVGQKASEHLEQHGQRARNVRESHRYKNAPTLRVPHPSGLWQSLLALPLGQRCAKHHVVHYESAHLSTT